MRTRAPPQRATLTARPSMLPHTRPCRTTAAATAAMWTRALHLLALLCAVNAAITLALNGVQRVTARKGNDAVEVAGQQPQNEGGNSGESSSNGGGSKDNTGDKQQAATKGDGESAGNL